MISRTINALARPVGSTFRQRNLYAEIRYGAGDVSRGEWIVSVVDSLKGPTVEAKRHHHPVVLIGTDLKHHSMIEDVLKQARDLLDVEDGWKRLTVKECSVAGCTNPQPLWQTEYHRTTGECLPCSVRSVMECVECGAPDNGTWQGREVLLQASLCMDCAGWRGRVEKQPQVVSEDFGIYSIGKGGGPASCKGFGGRKWVVTFTDGREVHTDDLWSGGQVPEWFRDRFTPNATVVPA